MCGRLNSPAIVYKTTRNVIPTFENINAVKARQWSFARSNGGFCLRRTDRFRSILLPFSRRRRRYMLAAFKLSSCFLSFFLLPSRPHAILGFLSIVLKHKTQLDIPLKYYFLCIQRTLVTARGGRRRAFFWGRLGEIEISLVHFLILFWS